MAWLQFETSNRPNHGTASLLPEHGRINRRKIFRFDTSGQGRRFSTPCPVPSATLMSLTYHFNKDKIPRMGIAPRPIASDPMLESRASAGVYSSAPQVLDPRPSKQRFVVSRTCFSPTAQTPANHQKVDAFLERQQLGGLGYRKQ